MIKVLLIDDMATVEKAYFDLLRASFKVEASIDAAEIVTRARRFQPEVVIINADLPDFDGVEVCRRVHDELGVPIILLIDPHSTRTTHIDSCEATEILTKPFEKNRLIEMVRTLVATSRKNP